MKKLLSLLLIANQAFAGSPVIWGPNSTATNLQNRVLHGTGALASSDGQKNYITYGTFENKATTGWSLGHVTLTSNFPTGSPTFGSGADSHLSLGLVTAGGALEKSYSLSYSSSTTTVAGDFVASQAYTIEPEDQGKVLQISLSYEAWSGASQNASNMNMSGTNSNSYGLAIYDVTNSAWIMPNGVWNFVQGTGVGTFTGTFQTPINLASMRLVLFNANATTGTGATLWLDSFKVGPQVTSTGPAMTDWVAYTPTFSGFGTVSGALIFHRRVGDSDEISGTFTSGTVAASLAKMSLPPGEVIDTTKMAGASNQQLVGTAVQSSTGAASSFSVIASPSNSTTDLYFSALAYTGVNPLVAENGNALGASSTYYSIHAKVPIVGWSSNTVQSADSDNRRVSLVATTTSTITGGSGSIFVFPIAPEDTHAAYNVGTGVYTIPVSGSYQIGIAGALSTTGDQGVLIKVNGSFVNNLITANTTRPTSGYAVLNNLKAGDTVALYGDTASRNLAYSAGVQVPTLYINRISGSAVSQASESVNAGYNTASGSSSSSSPINMTVREYDSHGAVTTGSSWKFTAPIPGVYSITANLNIAASGQSLLLYKNGVSIRSLADFASGSTFSVSTKVKLVAGDYIDLRTSGSSTPNSNALFGIYIDRVGN